MLLFQSTNPASSSRLNASCDSKSDSKNISLAPSKAEPVGRGEEDGPNIRDVGRVQEKLESPLETDNHLGLLLNLPEEVERTTVRTSGTLDEFKNRRRAEHPGRWTSSRTAGESIGDGRPPRAAVEPAGRGEEEDGQHSRDRGQVQEPIPRTSLWPPRKAEPAEKGEEDGPNIRDVGRVQEQLESPSETDDHLGLLLNLPEEARRRTVNTAGTVAKFKNLFQEHLHGPLEKLNLPEEVRRRTVNTAGTVAKFKNLF
ncbi:uncharacterized protein LOC120425187 [Culex pipiens pallens]|uniref:uncharacterized protein LOC120425187 n=1 Tax=Culex pipiens pallens TaxID=42434 RepID=UPI0022AA58F0|nr:uncharacterized protein LOC120425187 [Culex pipiens pallens]